MVVVVGARPSSASRCRRRRSRRSPTGRTSPRGWRSSSRHRHRRRCSSSRPSRCRRRTAAATGAAAPRTPRRSPPTPKTRPFRYPADQRPPSPPALDVPAPPPSRRHPWSRAVTAATGRTRRRHPRRPPRSRRARPYRRHHHRPRRPDRSGRCPPCRTSDAPPPPPAVAAAYVDPPPLTPPVSPTAAPPTTTCRGSPGSDRDGRGLAVRRARPRGSTGRRVPPAPPSPPSATTSTLVTSAGHDPGVGPGCGPRLRAPRGGPGGRGHDREASGCGGEARECGQRLRTATNGHQHLPVRSNGRHARHVRPAQGVVPIP